MLYPKFNRYCSMAFQGRFLTSPMTLEFEVTYKTRSVPSQATAKIYNPNEATITAAQKIGLLNPRITIIAGYEANSGIAMIGEITSFNVEQRGIDRILVLKISDNKKQWTSERVSRTFPPGVTASFIVRSLIVAAGLIPADVSPLIDKVYSRGVTFNTSFRRVMKQLARDTKSEMYIRNGQIVFQARKLRGIFPPVIIKSNEIIKIDKTKKGYKIKTFYNYKIQAGTPVSVASTEFAGTLKAINIKSVFSLSGNAYTELEGRVVL